MARTRRSNPPRRPASRVEALLAEAQREFDAGRWLLELPNCQEAVDHLCRCSSLAAAAARSAEKHFLLDLGIHSGPGAGLNWLPIPAAAKAAGLPTDSARRLRLEALAKRAFGLRSVRAFARGLAMDGLRTFKGRTLEAARRSIDHLEQLARLESGSLERRVLRESILAQTRAAAGRADGSEDAGAEEIRGHDEDRIWFRALTLAARRKYVSVPELQKELRIGYHRTVALIERMEREILVVPYGDDRNFDTMPDRIRAALHSGAVHRGRRGRRGSPTGEATTRR